MKLLIKNFFKKTIIYRIRNKINIKPIKLNLNNLTENYSISDAFLWRTDSTYKTIFKFSDLLNFFYEDLLSSVDLKFYDQNYNKIKELENMNILKMNQLLIDKNFLNGFEGYGTFYIFHKSNKQKTISIRNSCYTGFSYKNNLFSYVHGNLPSSCSKLNHSNNDNFNNIIVNSFFKNQIYIIQNEFSEYDKIEVFINNSSNDKLYFELNNQNYKLNKGCSKILELKEIEKIKIISNSYLLRPIIFNYKKNTIDVHHG
ncbi:MAG: hypothetical protein CMG74_04905 [Candidatus Marinimicrobia bacterium]|nr:hypothetical protein [Candidatus Neomarinimicrobiota bacterium]|tara:strand:- start:163 stop:933 length:771 start_codon:yes stop_codon:yes gene_type:complete